MSCKVEWLGLYLQIKASHMNMQGQLTNLQLELLRLFKYELPDNQLLEIRTLLAGYFADRASDEMDKLWDEKGWTPETMEEWLKKDLRKGNEKP